VIFAATADEEAGKGNHGAGWIIDHRPELWRARYIITEGGGHDLSIGDQRFYTVQTGQKGLCRLRLIARGTPGHGSMPHADNAIVKLSKAVAGLQGAELPVHISQSVRRMVEEIARSLPEGEAAAWLDLLDDQTSAEALAALDVDEEFRRELGAMLRNTASLTMLQAGSKINVIPAEATAWIDGRLAPGQSQASFVEELRVLIGDEVEVVVDQYTPPLEAAADSPLYAAIVEVMQSGDEEVGLLPYLLPAGTDAKHIVPRRPDTQIYGFMPYRQKPGEEEMKLIHGHDERTSIDELLFATQKLYEIVCRFAAVQ
jgi:acetylornithine deacetylase/succinyl-diaminopimelate desuccinylase-like protein